MNVETYKKRRHANEAMANANRPTRLVCLNCRMPRVGCFCHVLEPFNSKIKFVILIHPIEVRRKIATGRMAHLVLENSELILGEDVSDNPRVNEIINDPQNECVVMYPGHESIDVEALTVHEQKLRFRADKQLVIIVIDGTWSTSKKTMRSENLKRLPRICFTPKEPSRFRVRKQPAEGCYSTIEAIYRTIELMGESRGFEFATQQHRALITAFDWMVERQIMFSPVHNPNHERGHHAKCRQQKRELTGGSQLIHKP